MSKKRRPNQFLGGVRANRQPVPEITTAICVTDEVMAVLLEVLNPTYHRRQMLFQNAFITIRLIDRPRTNDSGISPGRRPIAATGIRADIAKRTVRLLAVIDIDEPFGEEGSHIGIVGGCAHKNLGIAHPAQPFIPLRAIGGDAEVISALTPLDVGLKLIQAGIRTGEFAGPAIVRGDDNARDVIR